MKIETIGIRNEYSIYIDGRKVIDIQDATNAYPFLLKTGKFKEVISDSLTHGISLLQSKGEVRANIVAAMLAVNKEQILESVYQTVRMQYQEEDQ